MKKQLFFYVLCVPFLLLAQTYETYRSDIYDPAGIDGDFFGSPFAVSDDGNRIAVASRFHDGATGTEANIGKVSMYEFNSGNWVKLGSDIVGIQAGDQLGNVLAMNAAGTIVAVGSRTGAPNGSNSGYVQVFEYNGTNWIQQGATFEGQSVGEALGTAVSMNADGTRLAIGSVGVNSGAGEVKVYSYNGSSWSQFGSTLSGVVTNDQFGTSVDMDNTGDFLAIGAPFVDTNGTPDGENRGQVKVYEYTSNWNEVFVATGFGANDILGSKVVLSGNGGVLAVAALQSTNFDPSNGPGYVRTYSKSGNTYTYFRDTFGENANDRFGRTLALNENGLFMAVGAPFNDTFGSNFGKTFLYKREVQGGVTNWYLRPGEYDDSETAGTGSEVGLNADGNILFTYTFYENDPNGVPGVIKTYGDLSTLSVEERIIDANMKIYPNPTTGIVNISNVSNYPISAIKVFDLTGRLCFEKNVNSIENVSIDMNDLSTGSYLVNIQSGQVSKTIKVNKR